MNKSTKPISYSDKYIYIGIDVHKKTYSVVAVADREVIKNWTTAASPEGLREQLLKYFTGAKIHTAYEAGFSGFALHRELVKYGINNIVVHAAGIETALHNRVKTDKRDAYKLATLLEAGRLKGIRIPSDIEERHRLLTRTRQQLIEERTAIKNKLRMKFHQFGLIDYDETRAMSHKFVKELLAKVQSQELIIVVEACWNIWKSLDRELAKLKKALKAQAEEDPTEATYQSVPGIGLVSARTLANELGDMSQFKNERQLFSYTGLTPSEYSSGEHVCKGHISRQGNRRVRAILVEIAWRVIEKDTSLAICFERLYPRIGKKRAIVAIARKLIGRIRAAFQHGETYRIGAA